MTDSAVIKLPTWFWVVAVVALIWNLLGVMAYLGMVYMSPEDFAAMTDAQQALMESTPGWVTGAFAIAVFGGVLGCLYLLLRKKLAIPLLGLSLGGVLVQMFHSFFLTEATEVYGAFQGLIMPVLVIVIALLLLIFARSARAKGWIS